MQPLFPCALSKLRKLKADGYVRGHVYRLPISSGRAEPYLLRDAARFLIQTVTQRVDHAAHYNLACGCKRYAKNHVALDLQLLGLGGVLHWWFRDDLEVGRGDDPGHFGCYHGGGHSGDPGGCNFACRSYEIGCGARSEEHTSELQSPMYL